MKSFLFCLLFGLFQHATAAEPIPFTLQNRSLQSIYLEIPGVMNPNLSPLSNSGVSLELGQPIYFFVKDEKFLLLTVDRELAGKKVRVKRLIRQRKRALGI